MYSHTDCIGKECKQFLYNYLEIETFQIWWNYNSQHPLPLNILAKTAEKMQDEPHLETNWFSIVTIIYNSYIKDLTADWVET